MNVFISTDIEGITGIVSWDASGGPDGSHYDWPFARRMYNHDINAAIRGARAAGAKRVVVKDSHGSCRNLLVDELEPGTELISGWPGASGMYMVQGIEADRFDALFLIGYHAMAGTERAVLEHALSGTVHRFWMNGEEVGEMAVSAALAGELGVPTVLVTSDDAGCREADAQIPGVQTYVTKTAMARFTAQLKHPSETGPGIEAAAKKALAGLGSRKALAVTTPVSMRAQFKEVHVADLAASLDYAVRLDAYTVEVIGDTVRQAHSRICNVFSLGARANLLK